jgi:hypothetical protein
LTIFASESQTPKSISLIRTRTASVKFPTARRHSTNLPVGFVNWPLPLYRFVPLVKDTTGRLGHILAASVPP